MITSLSFIVSLCCLEMMSGYVKPKQLYAKPEQKKNETIVIVFFMLCWSHFMDYFRRKIV